MQCDENKKVVERERFVTEWEQAVQPSWGLFGTLAVLLAQVGGGALSPAVRIGAGARLLPASDRLHARYSDRPVSKLHDVMEYPVDQSLRLPTAVARCLLVWGGDVKERCQSC